MTGRLADRLIEQDDAADALLRARRRDQPRHRLAASCEHFAICAAMFLRRLDANRGKRFLIVPSLSSAARNPFPGATSAIAVSCSSALALRCEQSRDPSSTLVALLQVPERLKRFARVCVGSLSVGSRVHPTNQDGRRPLGMPRILGACVGSYLLVGVRGRVESPSFVAAAG